MKKRWKPKVGETYYTFNIGSFGMYVSEKEWLEVDCDKIILQDNLVFRTKREAQAALKKLKKFIKEEL